MYMLNTDSRFLYNIEHAQTYASARILKTDVYCVSQHSLNISANLLISMMLYWPPAGS